MHCYIQSSPRWGKVHDILSKLSYLISRPVYYHTYIAVYCMNLFTSGTVTLRSWICPTRFMIVTSKIGVWWRSLKGYNTQHSGQMSQNIQI